MIGSSQRQLPTQYTTHNREEKRREEKRREEKR